MNIINPEIEKYRIIYGDPDFAGGTYGHSNHGQNAYPLIDEVLKPESIVDVGCGHNEFVKHFKGIPVLGVDFACPSADLAADIQELPLSNKVYDLITAFDVLEHLRPEQVEPALMEMCRVSRRCLVSICYRASHSTVAGENLHPTVRPKEWWKQLLGTFGAVSEWSEYLYVEWNV